MKTANFDVNYKKETITHLETLDFLNEEVSKEFLKLRELFPNFKVRARKCKEKNTHKDLSFEVMEIHIKKQPNHETTLENFLKVKEYFKNESSRYGKVKAWFLMNYPNITKAEIAEWKNLVGVDIVKAKEDAKRVFEEKAKRRADEWIRMIDANTNKPSSNVIPFSSNVVIDTNESDENQAIND